MVYRICLIIVFMVSVTTSQSISSKENQLSEINQKKSAFKKELNSLNNELETIVNQVDRLKASSTKNDKRITELMKNALALSEKVETIQRSHDSFLKRIKLLKNELHDLYTKKIDSLNTVLKQTNNLDKRARIEAEILTLSDKRLLTSPVIEQLSFNPSDIHQITSKELTDSLGKAIFVDYLYLARSEIDSHITFINRHKTELQNRIRLERKAETFLGDVENTQFLGYFENRDNPSSADLKNDEADKLNAIQPIIDSGTEPLQQQVNNYILLYNQLKDNIENNDNTYTELNLSLQKKLSLNDYLELLQETEKYLRFYDQLIREQLKIWAE
ncbi:MAG: hypothetical protein GF313_13000 [Caldithrix sp.]|nr:hypothetical protein [Caldithrix sp.]